MSHAAPAPAAPSGDTRIPKPPQLARELEDAMLAKATSPLGRMFVLALTGGGFIALGFVFMVTSQQGMAEVPLGISKLLGGVVFSVGLGLVVISGSDLFTGTTLTTMPWLSKRLSSGRMLLHWGISLLGNLLGALTIVILVMLAGTPTTNGSAWGLVVLNITQGKLGYEWHQAFVLGILANLAVCLAVWVAASGRTMTDKVIAVVGPIALFVATGFEHSVANMFMLPMGWVVHEFAGSTFWTGEAIATAGVTPADFDITVGAILADNLVPVLLGNIVGGAVFVGVYFWVAYRKDADDRS